MQNFLIILNQSGIMFLLIAVGYFLFKKNIIGDTTIKEITEYIINIATPAMIINSFNENTSEILLKKIIIMIILTLITTFIAILVSKIMVPNDRISQYGIIFGNTAFIGIPLILKLLGPEYVIFMTVFIAVNNIILWTYGIYLISGDKKSMSLKKTVNNPFNIAIFISICLLTFKFNIPSFISDSISIISSTTLPLILIILGCYLAQIKIISLFSNLSFYWVCLGKLIVVPTIVLLFLIPFPEEFKQLKIILVIAQSTPAAVLIAILAEKYKKNSEFEIGIIGTTTLLSLFSLPIMIGITDFFY